MTGQESSASATGEALLAASAADLQHDAGNIKTESPSGATSTREILTGKQEHCNYLPFYSPVSLSFACVARLADTGISLFLQRRSET